MAIAAVMANLSRILAWWREVDWRACAVYSVTGIPAAALDARTLLALPARAVDISIGLFLIAMIPPRHILARRRLQAPTHSRRPPGAGRWLLRTRASATIGAAGIDLQAL